jgi:hypothetical protein
MSAIGTKRTSLFAPHMSAIGGKADMSQRPTVFLISRVDRRISVDPSRRCTCEIARYALARRRIGTTEFWPLPSSAAAIRPAMDSDARRNGSLSRCA